MTINFYLDTRPQGDKPILIYVILSRNVRLKFNTGEKIPSEHWDFKKHLAKRSYVGHAELNSFLTNLKEKLLAKLRLLYAENDFVSADMVRETVNKFLEGKKPTDSKKIFFEAFNKFIEANQQKVRYRTIQKYKTLLQHLRDFEHSKNFKLGFEFINQNFNERFTSFLIEDLKHSNNTVGKYISCLKTFLKWAVDSNYNKNIEFTKFKVLNEKSDIIVLSDDELMKLYYLDLSGNKTLDKVRDVFLFQCFTGQRFSDIAEIKRDDIKNNSWYLHTYKTKDIIEIPLTELALEILDKYKANEKPLPIISHQKTNQLLKEVCKLAGIDEPITIVRYRGNQRIEINKPKYEFISTHTARRTFVTLSLEKGMKAETIMEITGHKNYKTFKKYLKITSKVKHNEMNKYWKKPAFLKIIHSNN